MIENVIYHADGSVSYNITERVKIRTFNPNIDDLRLFDVEERSKIVEHVTNKRFGRLAEIESE